MTNQHPITPPYELIMDWCKQRACINEPGPIHIWLATEAAQWGSDQQLKLDAEQIAQAYQKGADQELEACAEWLKQELQQPGWANRISSYFLYAARRPKSPSLKEQALEVVTGLEKRWDLQCDLACLRRALEALPND